MTDDPCSLIATAIPNPDNMLEMKTYLETASPLLAVLGGGPPNRMKVSDVVAGDPAARVMIMNFPSRAALVAVFESDEYQALIPGRDRGFTSFNLWIAAPM